jgi:glycosyltransferase involved in cell wall biosynthesis
MDRIQAQKIIKANKSLYPLGFISPEDLVKMYNLATVFIMPSLYEGFGLPVIEAMQSGCPVITSREGSLPEVVGDSAYYIDAYSTKSISEGLQEVFSSDELQEELKRKGLGRSQEFSWKKTAFDTLEVYKKAILNR